jgi:hypothetical protein
MCYTYGEKSFGDLGFLLVDPSHFYNIVSHAHYFINVCLIERISVPITTILCSNLYISMLEAEISFFCSVLCVVLYHQHVLRCSY